MRQRGRGYSDQLRARADRGSGRDDRLRANCHIGRLVLAGALACALMPVAAFAQEAEGAVDASAAAAAADAAASFEISDEDIIAAAEAAGLALAGDTGASASGQAARAAGSGVGALSASGVTDDGWAYSASAASVTLTGYTGASLAPTVPAAVAGLPVTGVIVNAGAGAPAITSLDLSAVKGTLAGLKVRGCTLTALDLSGFSALTQVDVADNTLSSLIVGDCTLLTQLVCSGNKLSALSVSDAASLVKLVCSDNRIRSLSVAACANLEYLDCSHNLLEALKVGSNLKLADCFCHHNYIADDLYALTSRFGSEQNVVLPQESGTVEVSVTRLSGDSRYDTMAAIVSEAYADDSCDTVLLASGDAFADALAASSLAGALDCPILTTPQDELGVQTLAQLRLLGASTVVIAGGTSAVSQGVEDTLTGLGYKVERAAGSSRVATSIDVAERTQAAGSSSKTCFIAKGWSFPDALAASPYAFATASPIFMANDDGVISSEVRAAITEGGYERVVLLGGSGGEGGIADVSAAELGVKEVTRLAGAGRYETAVEVATWSVGEGVLSWDGMALACGTNFPDALAGSALCGKLGSVLLLADAANSSCLESAVSPNTASVLDAYVLGGISAVPKEVEDALRSILC